MAAVNELAKILGHSGLPPVVRNCRATVAVAPTRHQYQGPLLKPRSPCTSSKSYAGRTTREVLVEHSPVPFRFPRRVGATSCGIRDGPSPPDPSNEMRAQDVVRFDSDTGSLPQLEHTQG